MDFVWQQSDDDNLAVYLYCHVHIDPGDHCFMVPTGRYTERKGQSRVAARCLSVAI